MTEHSPYGITHAELGRKHQQRMAELAEQEPDRDLLTPQQLIALLREQRIRG